MRRGQIALFVIIAVMLAASVIIFLAYREKVVSAPFAVPPSVKPVNDFVEGCLKTTGEDALIFIGKQGGYYEPPVLSIDNMPYYFYNPKSFILSKPVMENEISKYINDMLPFCTRNFIDFPDFYIEANPKNVKAKTTIQSNEVGFEVEWPVIIQKGKTTYRLREFSSKVKSRLNTVYDVAKNATAEQLKDPSSVCLSCLINMGIENDLYIDMADYGNNSIIFTITDKNVTIKNQPYEFTFANRY